MKFRLDNAAVLALSIGQRVRTLRVSQGLTQEKLAYESGLHSKGTLSKIEAGQQLATVAVLELLARRLGVELLDLFVTPDEGLPRHDLIEATRGRSAGELEALLLGLSRVAAPEPAEPFVEAQRPTARLDPPRIIPLLGLDVAAGSFEGGHADPRTRWVRPETTRRLHEGCFVARVVGRSMEPTLLDGAWAIFSRRVSDNPTGRVVIAQYGGLVDADTAASYTVKRFRGVQAPPGSESPWDEVRLEPDNRAFASIVVRRERLGDLTIVAELVEVLGAPPPAD